MKVTPHKSASPEVGRRPQGYIQPNKQKKMNRPMKQRRPVRYHRAKPRIDYGNQFADSFLAENRADEDFPSYVSVGQ